MAVQTGLGEPRGPWFISPDSTRTAGGPAYRRAAGARPGPAAGAGRLLAALAVVALSVVSGAVAGGVGGRPGRRGRARRRPRPPRCRPSW